MVMRQPQVINDPNAAPAAMRADDVDLQAQEGDFIMGYPAMQQSGPRVRSLVEQAMLRAKDKGVKTKGYKKGDKVDILVHNKEMHIPQEIIPYIDGGYATLKKLNKPSKYDEGDIVQEGFMEQKDDFTESFNESVFRPTENKTQNTYNWKDKYNKIASENMMKTTFQPVLSPDKGTFDFQYGTKNKNHPLFKNGKSYSDKVWEKFQYKVKKKLQSQFDFNKPRDIKNADILYNRIVNNIKNAIENTENTKEFSNPHVSTESILHPNFIDSAVRGSFLDYVLSQHEENLSGNKVKKNTRITNNRLDISYLNGMSNMSKAPYHPNKLQTVDLTRNEDLFLDYDDSDNISNFKNVMQERINTGNDSNESRIGTFGWDAFNTTEKNKKFPKKYKKLLKFLIDHEGFTAGMKDDAKGTKVQGYGIQLKPDQIKAGVEDIDESTAKKRLAKEILRREDISRNVYNHYTKGKDRKSFDKLPENIQMMLIEMSFNMGSDTKNGKGLAEFKNFIDGASLQDYNIMENEYHRKVPEEYPGLAKRNKEFFELFIAPYIGKYSKRILNSK